MRVSVGAEGGGGFDGVFLCPGSGSEIFVLSFHAGVPCTQESSCGRRSQQALSAHALEGRGR